MTTAPARDTSATIERSYVDTGLPYQSAIEAFETAVGHLDPQTAAGLATRATPWPDFEAAMSRIAGPSGLMVLAKLDQGAVASLTGVETHCCLYLVGNPAIAARIVAIDVRASLYVPFRVAIHQAHADSAATISFDRPSSSLGTLNNAELLSIGVTLDEKVDAVLRLIVRGA